MVFIRSGIERIVASSSPILDSHVVWHNRYISFIPCCTAYHSRKLGNFLVLGECRLDAIESVQSRGHSVVRRRLILQMGDFVSIHMVILGRIIPSRGVVRRKRRSLLIDFCLGFLVLRLPVPVQIDCDVADDGEANDNQKDTSNESSAVERMKVVRITLGVA